MSTDKAEPLQLVMVEIVEQIEDEQGNSRELVRAKGKAWLDPKDWHYSEGSSHETTK